MLAFSAYGINHPDSLNPQVNDISPLEKAKHPPKPDNIFDGRPVSSHEGRPKVLFIL